MGRRDPRELEILTPNQLAQRSGVGANRIRRAIRLGELRAVTAHSSWNRVLWSDFLEWLGSTRVATPPTVEQQVGERVAAQLRRENTLGA